MAFLIGAVADEFVNSTRGEIGTIATLELFSISVVSILISRNTHRINRRLVFILAAIVVALGHSLTIYAPDLNTVFIARIISGIGSGAIVATIMATIAKAQNAQMTFALLNSGVGAAGVLLSLVIPRIISIYGMDGAYFIHLVFSLLAFLFILFISFEKDSSEEKTTLKPLSLIHI